MSDSDNYIRDQIVRLQEQNCSYFARLLQAEKDAVARESKNRELQEQLEFYMQQCAVLQKRQQNDHLEAQDISKQLVQERESLIMQLSAQVDDLNDQLVTLKEVQAGECAEKTGLLQQQLQELELAHRQLQQSKAESQECISSLLKGLHGVQGDALELKAGVFGFQRVFEVDKEFFERQFEAFGSQIAQYTQKQTQRLERYEAEVQEHRAWRQLSSGHREHLMSELQRIATEAAELRNSLNVFKFLQTDSCSGLAAAEVAVSSLNSLYRQQVADQQQAFAAQQQKVAALASDFALLREQNGQLIQQNDQLSCHSTQMNEQNALLARQNGELSCQNGQLAQQNDQLSRQNGEAGKLLAVVREGFKCEIAALRDGVLNLAAFSTQKEQFGHELACCCALIAQRARDASQQAAHELQATCQAQVAAEEQNRAMQSKIQQMEAEQRQSASAALEAATERTKNCERQLSDAQQQLFKAQQELQTLSEQSAAEKAGASALAASLRLEIAEAERESQQLREALSQAEHLKSAAQKAADAEIAGLRAELSELQRQSTGIAQASKDAAEENQSLARQQVELKESVRTLKEGVVKQRALTAQLQAQLTACGAEKQALLAQVEQLTTQANEKDDGRNQPDFGVQSSETRLLQDFEFKYVQTDKFERAQPAQQDDTAQQREIERLQVQLSQFNDLLAQISEMDTKDLYSDTQVNKFFVRFAISYFADQGRITEYEKAELLRNYLSGQQRASNQVLEANNISRSPKNDFEYMANKLLIQERSIENLQNHLFLTEENYHDIKQKFLVVMKEKVVSNRQLQLIKCIYDNMEEQLNNQIFKLENDALQLRIQLEIEVGQSSALQNEISRMLHSRQANSDDERANDYEKAKIIQHYKTYTANLKQIINRKTK